MQVGLLSVLFSLCVVSTVGRFVLMELDVETVPAIPLLEADPIKRVGDLWTNCTAAGDKASINSVTISPAAPVKGENISVNMSITFKEAIANGTIELKVKFGVIPIFSKSFNLCTISADGGLNCPIAAGTQSLKITAKFPSAIPSGTYNGSIIAKTTNGDKILCVDFHIEL